MRCAWLRELSDEKFVSQIYCCPKWRVSLHRYLGLGKEWIYWPVLYVCFVGFGDLMAHVKDMFPIWNKKSVSFVSTNKSLKRFLTRGR
jgi:hypothetical protein